MNYPVGLAIEQHRVCPDCLRLEWDGGYCSACGYTDGQVVSDANALEPGPIVGGRYVLGLVLGYPGGFGITYRGLNIVDGSKVAIKEFMPSQLAGRSRHGTSIRPLGEKHAKHYEHLLMRFRGESEILRSLAHPHIVEVLDFFEQNDTAYLVMPFIEGITLAEYVERAGGKISFESALAIMTRVMDALRFSHARNLIHRDVSPENIFITLDKRVILLDFGAARSPIPGLELTCIMKLGFSPLEVIRGQQQGPYTDVYGVAATIYNACSGRELPFAVDRLEGEAVMPLRALGVKISDEAEAALTVALALQPSNRIKTIAELQRGISPAPAPPEPPPSPPPPPPPSSLSQPKPPPSPSFSPSAANFSGPTGAKGGMFNQPTAAPPVEANAPVQPPAQVGGMAAATFEVTRWSMHAKVCWTVVAVILLFALFTLL